MTPLEKRQTARKPRKAIISHRIRIDFQRHARFTQFMGLSKAKPSFGKSPRPIGRSILETANDDYTAEYDTARHKILKAWLKNTDVCIPVILNCAKELSDSVDEYWD